MCRAESSFRITNYKVSGQNCNTCIQFSRIRYLIIVHTLRESYFILDNKTGRIFKKSPDIHYEICNDIKRYCIQNILLFNFNNSYFFMLLGYLKFDPHILLHRLTLLQCVKCDSTSPYHPSPRNCLL